MKPYAIAMVLVLAACRPEWDMQGHDPRDYYAANPIKNQVKTSHAVQTVQFAGNKLTDTSLHDLRVGLQDVSPMAVESITVQMHPVQVTNPDRRLRVSQVLRDMGFAQRLIRFEPLEEAGRNEAMLDVAYAEVISPRCPDWRTSPVTTYSNTHQGNFGCANTVNLGLMVADPRDLVRGDGDVHPDTERTTKVIRDYRSGSDLTAPSSSSSASDAATGVSADTTSAE